MGKDENEVIKTPETVLQEHHVYTFSGPVTMESCTKAIQWILSENVKGVNNPLTMIITSFGGQLDPTFGLIDIMMNSPAKIRTIGAGCIMSAGFLIFLAGDERMLTRNVSILSHQLSAFEIGKYHDLVAYQDELKQMQEKMVRFVGKRIGMSVKDVKKKLLGPTDKWLTPAQALKFGITHKIIQALPKL